MLNGEAEGEIAAWIAVKDIADVVKQLFFDLEHVNECGEDNMDENERTAAVSLNSSTLNRAETVASLI